jgi:pimeloyl-ACP methyl ester carboxylesterase
MRARGLELEARVDGPVEGRPFFWGHGLMCSIAQEDDAGMLPWRRLGEDTRLIRWDARGHGSSEATLPPEHYRWTELAKDLWALVDAFETKRCVLGGVSMGAATALHAAVAQPDRVIAMVLMAPPTAWESRPRQAGLYRRMAKLIEWLGLGPFRWLGRLAALPVQNKGLAAIQSSVVRGLRHADPRAVQAALRGAALSDLPDRERLRGLDIPTLILAWTQDPSHPLATAETLAKTLPRAELHVASSFEDIEAWPDRLRAFLSELPAA